MSSGKLMSTAEKLRALRQMRAHAFMNPNRDMDKIFSSNKLSAGLIDETRDLFININFSNK